MDNYIIFFIVLFFVCIITGLIIYFYPKETEIKPSNEKTDAPIVFSTNSELKVESPLIFPDTNKLLLQSDGNLVYMKNDNTQIWGAATELLGSSKLVLQSDNNLVLYDTNGAPVWTTATDTKGVLPTSIAPSSLVSKDNVLKLLDPVGTELWNHTIIKSPLKSRPVATPSNNIIVGPLQPVALTNPPPNQFPLQPAPFMQTAPTETPTPIGAPIDAPIPQQQTPPQNLNPQQSTIFGIKSTGIAYAPVIA